MNKTEFTKRCIADALFELLKVKDYHDISVKDIVEKAGFSRMSYYRNFKSYDEVLDYFLDSHFFETYQRKKVSFDIKHVKNAIHLFKLSLEDDLRREIDDVFVKQGLEHIIFFNTRKHILAASNDERRYADLFISGGFNEIWYLWVLNGHKETPEEIIKQLSEQIDEDLLKIFEETATEK